MIGTDTNCSLHGLPGGGLLFGAELAEPSTFSSTHLFS